MNFNLTEVKAKSLSGQVSDINLCTLLGDVIYNRHTGIKWERAAHAIYDGQDIDLDESDLKDLRALVVSDGLGLVIAVKVAIRDYIDSLISQGGGEEVA